MFKQGLKITKCFLIEDNFIIFFKFSLVAMFVQVFNVELVVWHLIMIPYYSIKIYIIEFSCNEFRIVFMCSNNNIYMYIKNNIYIFWG